ncbi:hypothetical protein [Nonomuraea sp. NPDC005650]|uniref:hypothetical protein n=1 Tax=Nonomuraea sp. NPDC005650 TaxID=3157045 RepID=UPI0033A8AC43
MDSVIGTLKEHPAVQDALAGPVVPGRRLLDRYVVPPQQTEAIGGALAARRLVGAEGFGAEQVPAAGVRACAGEIVTWGDRGR